MKRPGAGKFVASQRGAFEPEIDSRVLERNYIRPAVEAHVKTVEEKFLSDMRDQLEGQNNAGR